MRQSILSPNGNGHKKFKCEHTTNPHSPRNLICDKIPFAHNNTYRNLTNCYHHPAGSFTTIYGAIARAVYRHACLMPVQMHVDTYIHVCMCGASCFVFTNAANKLDVN